MGRCSLRITEVAMLAFTLRMRMLLAAVSLALFTLLSMVSARSQTNTVTVTGTLTDEGVECRAMRDDQGVLYTLTPKGRVAEFQPSDRIRVSGNIAQISMCQQGTTIEVAAVEKAE
jgi:hypothetical protein